MLQLWLFAPSSLYFTSCSSPSTQLTHSVRVSVSMWKRIYICLYVQPCIHKHIQNTHTYMCFCLNGPSWFSHGYLLVISQQQTVKAPTTPTSLNTVAYISFPCLHIVLHCPREDRDSLSKWRRWDVEVAGHQGLWLHLSISLLSSLETDGSYQLFMMNNAQMTRNKCVLGPGQQIHLKFKWPKSFLSSQSPLAQ